MSILNVNKINPVGGGSTITIAGIASVTSSISIASSVTATSYFGDGSGLTNTGAISTIASDGAARVLTSDGDGTATAHSFVTIESSRLSVNRGSGSGAFPLIVRRTDASGIIAEFANSSGYGLLIGQNSATGEAYLRTGTGQPLVITTNAGSGITNERLRITSEGYVTKPQQPCFDVTVSNGPVSGGNDIVFNDADLNIGTHYSTSNGRFTAPVTGQYFFYYGGLKNNNSNVCRLKLYKTGSSFVHNRELRLDDGDAYGENGSMSIICTLNATDYVTGRVTEGQAYGGSDGYTYFGGYLLS